MRLLEKYGLKFPAETEARFHDFYFKKSIGVARLALLLAIVLYLLYTLLDIIMLPETRTFTWMMRLGVQIPMMVLTLIFSYRKVFRKYWQVIMTVNTLVAGLGIIAMIMYSKPGEPAYDHYFSGLILIVVWACTFSRLTFLYSTSTAFTIIAAYAVLQITMNHRFADGITSVHASVFINSMVCLGSVYLLGVCAAFSIEYFIRGNYRHQLIIKQKQDSKISDVDSKVNVIMQNLIQSTNRIDSTAQTLSSDANSLATTFEEITATMEEISSGIENTAGNSETQYNEMNNLLTRMEQFTHNIRKMQHEVQMMHDKSRSIMDVAEVGDRNMNKMSNSMSIIQASSVEMTNIVGIIKKISDEINLLSLNASIEAARAGQAGRGFAVVADAISKLADETSTSIQGIDKLIETNKQEIDSGMVTVADTVRSQALIIEAISDNFKTMMSILGYINGQLEENELIYKDADSVRTKSQEIKYSTEEQKTATVEILNSITSLNPLSSNNASMSSDLVSTAQNLNDNVTELNEMVLKLAQ